ncbi:hypothetical protein M407DRAFT_11103 [Tulasnella calospora MUT 4182]|uniref:MMS19 nucleotide excision repair protein n=1 Tax=Tulasnella calospora MUT 4182 TaxID=1051891 RepID=A0A0C3PXX9_9AGAM|nr:hypothetical protein M407DRAFT_11103 [Tulasnella calospora MUT 4182]
MDGWRVTSSTLPGVAEKDFTLLNVIKALGPALTAEEGDHRSRGVELLSTVMEKCPPERLDKHSTHVLYTFYEQKLDDSDTVIPALHGLLTLVSLPTFASSDVVSLFQALVQHVNMKAHVQSTRYIVFRILDTLVAKHRDVLKGMGDEFLRKYVSIVEGEKDPRNLLMAFSIDRVVLIEWEVKSYIEDFFDVTFCYFPITFKPPPNDPYKISTDDLKAALRSCLSASPFFGTLAVPIFMEKLAATTAAVKQDVLQTMSICLPVYGPAVAQKFGNTIWDAVKIEIFQPIDSETEKAALEATSALVQTLSSTDEKSPSSLVTAIITECIEILKEPEKNKAQHAIKVLSALLRTTHPVRKTAYLAALTTLVKYLPQSMYMHQMTTLMPLFILGLDLPEVEMRANVIEALVTLASETDASEAGALAEHVSTVINALTKNALPDEMTSTRLRVAALKCLGVLPQAVSYERLHPYTSNVLRQLGRALDDRSRPVRKVAVDAREVW